MEFRSDSWADGAPFPAACAAGEPDGAGGARFGANLSPHFAWRDAPAGTRSYALVCHDPDVPSRGDDVNQPGREVPADLPRVDFFHWALADIPADATTIAEGAFSRGFTPRGKPGPAVVGVAGFEGARHGLNDYTGWFAADPERAGDYFGYDGPFPPFNDARVHRYVFTLYALDVARAPVDGAFTGAQLRAAIRPHVLEEAALTGTYTLNQRLFAPPSP